MQYLSECTCLISWLPTGNVSFMSLRMTVMDKMSHLKKVKRGFVKQHPRPRWRFNCLGRNAEEQRLRWKLPNLSPTNHSKGQNSAAATSLFSPAFRKCLFGSKESKTYTQTLSTLTSPQHIQNLSPFCVYHKQTSDSYICSSFKISARTFFFIASRLVHISISHQTIVEMSN